MRFPFDQFHPQKRKRKNNVYANNNTPTDWTMVTSEEEDVVDDFTKACNHSSGEEDTSLFLSTKIPVVNSFWFGAILH